MTKRALVLGGGGPVGIAWEAGLLAALAAGSVDLAKADRIVGTSAGSFVGAQLALGRTARELADAILAEAQRSAQAQPVAAGGRPAAPVADLTFLFRKMNEAAAGDRDAQAVRREIGTFSLAAETMDEEAFIKSFGRGFSGLAEDTWPGGDFVCTAVDAQTGEFVVWNREAGVGVVRAVASSCSVPGVYPAVTIGGRRYIDGGMRSSTNADLAAGFEKVVVVAVRSGPDDPRTARLRQTVDQEIAGLRGGGAAVEFIVPDEASVAAFGANLMDFRRRPGAAGAGEAQGHALAQRLHGFWG
jgi:NTE family protein